MPEPDDHQLLGEFARARSESAFAALVARYVNLVYSTALRFTGNPHHAEEITQAVFVILARKVGTLSPRVVLSGWLYQTARLTAANFKKGEIRRQHREQEAYMQSTLNEPNDPAWTEIAPLLDEAIGRLGETDRNAIVLRFFENKTSAEIGAVLRMNEETARKRVNRALDKLRGFFGKRGVVSTTAVIAGAMSANSVHAAPVQLAPAITATVAKGVTISATLTTLVHGTMKTMTWLKLKFAIGVGTAVVLAAGVTTVAVSQISDGLRNQMTVDEIVQRSQAAYAALTSYGDEGIATGTVGGTTAPPNNFTIKLARPSLYRIAWQQDMGTFAMTGMVWSAGSDNFMQMTAHSSPQKYPTRENNLAAAAGVSDGASGLVPQCFFNPNGKNHGDPLPLPATRKPDAKVGDVDCYVLTHADTGLTQTVWIDKQSFLIRQAESDVSVARLQKTIQMAEQQNPKLKGLTSPVAGDVVLTQTHENIVVNEALSPSDFAH